MNLLFDFVKKVTMLSYLEINRNKYAVLVELQDEFEKFEKTKDGFLKFLQTGIVEFECPKCITNHDPDDGTCDYEQDCECCGESSYVCYDDHMFWVEYFNDCLDDDQFELTKFTWDEIREQIEKRNDSSLICCDCFALKYEIEKS